MPRLIVVAVVMASSGALLAPQAAAIELGSAACKREMQAMQKKMRELVALVDSVKEAPGAERCKALSQHLDLAEKFARASRAARPPRSAPARCATPTR